LAAGVKVAMSTDLPFGGADPWAAIRAATRRATASGAVLGPSERIGAATALEMFLGSPDQPTRSRTIAPGQPSDLCVLAAAPDEVLGELDATMVSATIVDGNVVFEGS
jgi:predicted amidohydrolase YtcJ